MQSLVAGAAFHKARQNENVEQHTISFLIEAELDDIVRYDSSEALSQYLGGEFL